MPNQNECDHVVGVGFDLRGLVWRIYESGFNEDRNKNAFKDYFEYCPICGILNNWDASRIAPRKLLPKI